jgi:hypothetical protein
MTGGIPLRLGSGVIAVGTGFAGGAVGAGVIGAISVGAGVGCVVGIGDGDAAESVGTGFGGTAAGVADGDGSVMTTVLAFEFASLFAGPEHAGQVPVRVARQSNKNKVA